MKWLLIIVAVLMFSIWGMNHTFAEDSHKHVENDKHNDQSKNSKHADKEDEDEHKEGKEHGHDEEEKHAHGEDEEAEEESSSVGPDKGILAKSENGFQLAPEAVKTFGLKSVAFINKSIQISQQAIVQIKNEKTIFRLRDNWYKRVPIKIIRSTEDQVLIESPDLKSGDLVVVQATGFLRMAEVAAEGGASHGHSH